MSSYKLTYSNAKGLGEPIRFLLMKIDEDVRVPFEFTGKALVMDREINDKCPRGQISISEFDGKLAQSLAITRHLALKLKLAGIDDVESAKCDEYVDIISDLTKDFFPIYVQNDPVKKLEVTKSISDNLASKYFVKLEALVSANGGKHLVGNHLTWADMYFAFFANHVSIKFGWDFLAAFPHLQSVVENVFEVPQFNDWVEKCPKTEL